MTIILLGFLIAFLASIPPVGPITVLVTQRGLLGRSAAGAALATGGAIAEGAYAGLAALGMDHLLEIYPTVAQGMRWAAVVLIAALGLALAIRRNPHETAADKAGELEEETVGTIGKELVVGLSISGLNPTLILTWSTCVALILSLFGLRFTTLWQRLAFPIAVTAGIVAWFLIWLALLQRFGAKLDVSRTQLILRLAGAFLVLLAILQTVELLG